LAMRRKPHFVPCVTWPSRDTVRNSTSRRNFAMSNMMSGLVMAHDIE
jgi:hypothetical protein